jgi:hypothetical protein
MNASVENPPALAPALPSHLHGPTGSAWLDPVRWSWLVRSYGLFLVVTTLAAYMSVVIEIMAPWLPPDRREEPRGLTLLVWLLLPLMLSQAFGALWMVLVARVRAPDESPTLALAREAIALAGAAGGRLRSPRVLTGDVADPRLISVLGIPFLILPSHGIDIFYHALGEEEGKQAFRAVIVHEMGHALLWDDLLFVPSFVYLASGFALDLFGFGLAFSHRLDWSVPITHVVLLSGLALLAGYVIRRREAFSDAFSAVTLKTERPIRSALEALQNLRRHRFASPLAPHFEPARRLAWLDGRGRPFLDMSAADLGILALVNLTVGTSPFTKISIPSTVGHIIVGFGDGFSEIACTAFSVLVVAGMMIGREGRLPLRRELFYAATVCALGEIVYRIAERGTGGLWSALSSLSDITMEFVLHIIPFVLVVRVLCRWSLAVLWRYRRGARDWLIRGAVALAVSAFILHNVFLIAMRRVMLGMIPAILGRAQPDADALLRVVLNMYAVLAANTLVGIVLFLVISRWSTHVLRGVRAIACRACGTSASFRNALPMLWGPCASCGASLTRDFVVEIAD